MFNKQKKPKILIWDIESSYSIMASFSMWPNYIPHDNIMQEWNIICAAWKFVGKSKIHTVSVTDNMKNFKKDSTDDYEVVKKLREVILDADIIVAHNGDKFDLKKLNTRILFHGLDPLPKKISIDTLKVAKREFNFTSNKLDYIAKYLGYDGKLSTGNGLWMKALRGCAKSIKAMMKYNKQDVVVLENIYKRFLPYMSNHPNINLLMGNTNDHESCHKCGSVHVEKRGYTHTAAAKYQRYKCKGCNSWFRGKKAVATSNTRHSA